jgi:hypothetical protein
MFRNREIKVSVQKKDPIDKDPEAVLTFQEKAEIVRDCLDGVATKLFLGLCVYIWMDTRRQVKIEQTRQYYK